MIEFVPAQKKTFETEPRKNVINARQRLRHPVVVRVFGFESKFQQTARYSSREAPGVASQSAIGSESPKRGVSLPDQSHPLIFGRKNITLCSVGSRGAESH